MESVIALWKALLNDPRRVGSITPSGLALREAIVKVVLSAVPGCVVELGAGTGAITRSLVEVRGQLDDLIVIEQSPELVCWAADIQSSTL